MIRQMQRTPAGSASRRRDIPQPNICTPSRGQLCRGVGRPMEWPVSGVVPLIQNFRTHHPAVTTLCKDGDLVSASENLDEEAECVYG